MTVAIEDCVLSVETQSESMVEMKIDSWKQNAEMWIEASGQNAISTFFHWFDDWLKNGYAGLLNHLAENEEPLEELGKKTDAVLEKLMIMTFIVLLVGFLVPVPKSSSGVSVIDNSTWTAVLSFEGACAIGYIAIMPWLAQVNARSLVALLTGGLRSELLQLNPNEKLKSIDEFESSIEQEIKEGRATAQIMSRSIVYGGALLFGVIGMMLMGIWLTGPWKLAVLSMSVYWLWSILQSLFIPALLAYSDLMLRIYHSLKTAHEGIKEHCSRCRPSQKAEIGMAVVRASKTGTGKWFWRVVWLFLWGMWLRKAGGTFIFHIYMSHTWIWILLFVPPYVQILTLVYKRLKAFLRKSSIGK